MGELRMIDNDTPISDLPFDLYRCAPGTRTRILRCLSGRGVDTVGELVRMTRRDLLCLPAMGEASVNLIAQMLAHLGIPLASMGRRTRFDIIEEKLDRILALLTPPSP